MLDFNETRWKQVEENWNLWWKQELGRPVITATLPGRDPGRPKPDLPLFSFATFYDLSVPAEDIVDRWDYELSSRYYLGDAYPTWWPNLGAGTLAAFLGAEVHNGVATETTWFKPTEVKDVSELSFKYNPDTPWTCRARDLMQKMVDRWGDTVNVSIVDLGEGLDVLSTFRPSSLLPMDLYDHPEEVKRLVWELYEAFWAYWDDFQSVIGKTNRGYSHWPPLWSPESYFMFQCDFCYMIGPEMFDEFVKPELTACFARTGNPFYHLDGPGELPHLDSLLSIPNLKGVQWVPGDGNPPITEWPEVLGKITDAGKLIQWWGDTNTLRILKAQLGRIDHLALGAVTMPNWGQMTREEIEEMIRFAEG